MLQFFVSMTLLVIMVCLAVACSSIAEIVAEHHNLRTGWVKFWGIVGFCFPIALFHSLN